jgi:PAS domain S-box-containing protein
VITFVNRQAVSLFGYDPEDVRGQPVDMPVAEPLLQIYAEHRRDSLADPRTRCAGPGLELSRRHRGGTRLPVCLLSHIDTGDFLLDHGGG